MKIIVFAYIIKSVLLGCMMEQKCNIKDDNCIPGPAKNSSPEILTGNDIICEEYRNKLACCNNAQNILLSDNFKALDQVFGSDYGGCDMCSINLKRLYCQFTCSSNQDQFLEPDGYMESDIVPRANKTLFKIKLHLNKKMNCDLFNSCRKTKYANQLAAMSNAIGFTTFQGVNAYQKANIFINMTYVDQGGLDYDIAPCDYYPKDGNQYGFIVKNNCTCNTCYSDKLCVYDNDPKMNVMEGFSLLKVLVVYMFVILITLLIYFIKRNKQHDGRSRATTFSDMGINQQNTLIDN